MSRKCRKGLFNGLFIANIRKNILKNWQTGSWRSRNVHAGLCHQHHQTDGFECDGFPTSVGTGKHNCKGPFIKFDVNWNHFIRVDKRVTRTRQLQNTAGMTYIGFWFKRQQFRFSSLQIFRITGTHEDKIQICHNQACFTESISMQGYLAA